MSDTRSDIPTILFAGGGTGGHLFPSLAIAERLPVPDPAQPEARGVRSHFVCSEREIDRMILEKAGVAFTPVPQTPLPSKPWGVFAFLWSWLKSRAQAKRLMSKLNVKAVVAMGGFVSAPVIAAARSKRVPVMMVNLDAVPGKANRMLARKCDRLFTVYQAELAGKPADLVPMPLRRVCLFSGERAEAKRRLGLDPERPVLFVTGASQGATSLNTMMIELLNRVPVQAMLARWQVLHLAGPGRAAEVEAAYKEAGLKHRVLDFCDEMGLAWGSADLAISRAGAGSVAEAVANAVPTVFLPYPHHKDQHQRRNVEAIVEQGGAVLFDDRVDPIKNADRLQFPIMQLMDDPDRLERMRRRMHELDRGDGADRLATEALELAKIDAKPTEPEPAAEPDRSVADGAAPESEPAESSAEHSVETR